MNFITKKNILISFFVLLFLFILTLFFIFIYKNSLLKKDREARQIYFSNHPGKDYPITTFAGKILSVEENAILVAQTFTVADQNKNITYKVLITDKTIFNAALSVEDSIPYFFKDNTATPSLIFKYSSIKDLKPNQEIIVNSNIDLRTLKSNEFEASSIIVQPLVNTVYGTITAINGKTISLRGFPPDIMNSTQSTPLEKSDYVVTVTPQTEISRLSEQNTGIRLSFGDLKVGNHINVFAKVDTRLIFTFDAMRIEPSEPLLPSAISPTVTLSPTKTTNPAKTEPIDIAPTPSATPAE